MSVYLRLPANSIQKPSEKGKVFRDLLARIVDLREMNVLIVKI